MFTRAQKLKAKLKHLHAQKYCEETDNLQDIQLPKDLTKEEEDSSNPTEGEHSGEIDRSQDSTQPEHLNAKEEEDSSTLG